MSTTTAATTSGKAMAETWIDENGRKTFVPIENNPEVMLELSQLLGVSPSLGFYDIYSLTDPSLLSHIPRPIYSLIFLCPEEVFFAAGREVEKKQMLVYDGSGNGEPVIWFKQTIGNACGLMALLHSLCNGVVKDKYLIKGGELDQLLNQAISLKPKERAELLYNSNFLEISHQSIALKGDSISPKAKDPNGLHFISFVKVDGKLWELNGGMKGPLMRGELKDDEDVISERALELGVGGFLKKAEEKGIQDLRFSIVEHKKAKIKNRWRFKVS